MLLHAGSEWADLDELAETYGVDPGCARETMSDALWAAVVEVPGLSADHVGITLIPRTLVSEWLLGLDLGLLDAVDRETVDRLARFQRTMAPLLLPVAAAEPEVTLL